MAPTTADIITQLGIVLAAALVGGALAWLAPRLRGRLATDRSRARAMVLLVAAAAAFAVAFICLAVKKFDSFQAPAVDLGIQHHVFWAGGRGYFLYQTVLFTTSHLNHVALVNQLISPLSLLFPAPGALIVIQVLALASAAFPAYFVARRHTPSAYLALAFALSLLLFASVHWVSLYDFHPRVLAPALVLWAFWGMEGGRPRLGLLCFFITVLLLEELALYVCAAGLFVALGLKQVRWGLLVAGFSAVYFLVATYIIYPQLMDVNDVASNPILHTFGVAGTPVDLLKYAARQPLVFLERAANPARGAYLLHMLTPWAFLPVAPGWGWVAYVTPVTYALFSRVPSHYGIQYQYTMPLVPFLVYFAIRAWGRIEKSASRHPSAVAWARRAATAYLILAGVASAWAFGPLGLRYNPSWYNAEPWTRRFPRAARFISRDRSLGASMFLLPHFSQRRRIYLLPHKFRYVERLFPGEIVACPANVREPWSAPAVVSEARSRITLVRLLRDERYGCVYANGDYVLLRRGVTPVISAAKVFEWTYQTIEDDAFDHNVGVRVIDERARNNRALYCGADQGLLGTMARTAPRYWPPGVVKVNYRMAVDAPELPFSCVAELVVVERRGSEPPAAVAVKEITAAGLPSHAEYGWASVAFDCEKESQYEFQLYPSGNGDIYLDYIYVEAPTLSLERAFRYTRSDSEREMLAAQGEAMRADYRPPPPGFWLR